MSLAHKALAALILIVQLVLLVFLGLRGGAMPSDNSIETFAVAGTRAEADFHLLQQHFQAAEHCVVVLQYPTGGNHQEEADATFAQFAQQPGISRHLTSDKIFPQQVEDPPTPPLPLHQADRGLYIGYFQPDPEKAKEAMAAFSQLQSELVGQGNLQRVVIAGEPVVNDQLDQASLEVKYRFFPLLITLSLLLLGLLFRDLKVLLVAGLSIGGSLATTTGIMALAGETMNLVTNLTPALIFVLATAMQVHVLISIAARGSIVAGVRAKLKPNFLIALTTSIGFGSLMTSAVIPIATMGKYMALGIWVIFIWSHLVHFGLSMLIEMQPHMPKLGPMMALVFSSRYGRLLKIRFLWLVPITAIVLGSIALLYNPSESNGLRYFKPDHPLRQHTGFLETHVTGSSVVEILLAAPEPGDDTYVPEDEHLPDLETRIASLPHVRHLLSLSRMSAFAEACDEVGLEPQLEETMLEPFLSPAYYRIQLLVDSLDRKAYDTLRNELTTLLKGAGYGEQMHITGVLDRIIEIQRYLLSSLLQSLGLTVAAVVVLLLILLGRGAPILALTLPNLFPLSVMALAMWAFQIPTTISSVMVFSVAFGIAVDDTIHLVHAYGAQQGSHVARWQHTLTADARAVALTTVVLTLGFGVLATSTFLPTQHFGFLLGTGMVAAFVGDLLFLPGMLKS